MGRGKGGKKLGALGAAQLPGAKAWCPSPNPQKRLDDQTQTDQAIFTLLNNCASCAAPLPRLAKQCSRCKTRYCSAAYADAKSLMLPLLRGLDSRVEQNPLMRRVYAETLYKTEGASRDDVSKAATTLEDVLSVVRKRLGAGHPDTLETLAELDRARMMLEDKFQH